MPQATEALLALPDKRARQLAGISMRQLRYWEEVGLIVPSIRRQMSPRKVVRLYTYPDLLELLVAATIRNLPNMSLQHLRRVVNYLRKRHGYQAPLRELKYAVVGNEIYFQHPGGEWESEFHPDQVILDGTVHLEPIRARVLKSTQRDKNAAGEIVRRRGVRGSKPIFKGTRIPVATVQRFLEHGYDAERILEEYPSLTLSDIEALRRHIVA